MNVDEYSTDFYQWYCSTSRSKHRTNITIET